ncbi:hypothetical protein A5852_000332, partial [Enterococcus faecium]
LFFLVSRYTHTAVSYTHLDVYLRAKQFHK